jgi:hypothetical protein
MAIGNTQTLVKEELRNESARKTIVALANKSLTTPCYATKIRTSQELDIFYENYSVLGNIQCLFFDIFNVNKILQKRETGLRQKTLFGETIDEVYLFLKENFVFMIDPCTELFYNQSPNREKYKAIKGLPDPIKDILKNSFLFSWDNIPGNDSVRLINSLRLDYDIDWVKIAKIEKSYDGTTIKVFTEKNYLSLKLNDEKTEVNLKIDDSRNDKLLSKIENGNLNIYKKNSDVKTHYNYWTQLIEGKHIQSLATWYAKYQSENNADIIIPPSPLIDGIHEKLIDYAIDVNRKSIRAAEALGKPSALYFLINYPVFTNSETFFKVNEGLFDVLIEDDEELSSVKLIIIKIKNYRFADANNSVARENLKIFLSSLGTISRNTERGVLLLDADSLGLIALFNGIDCYAEPLNEKIQEQWGKASTKTYLGKYYHPEKLESLPFEELNNRIYKKSNKILPCSCPACLSLNGKNLDSDRDLWNTNRKIHKLHCRNQEINEVIKAIENNGIRGISNKLSKSSISQYKDILTNGF